MYNGGKTVEVVNEGWKPGTFILHSKKSIPVKYVRVCELLTRQKTSSD